MNKAKKIGIYAGSFNPFHKGHANILHQAQEVFDEVIIAIGQNPKKSHIPREPFPDKHPILKGAKVVYYSGLLSDFLNTVDFNSGDKISLVRGLRNGDDLQMEQNQIQYIKDMYPSVRPVFFICDKGLEHIASSDLRALKSISEAEYQKYVFEQVPNKGKSGAPIDDWVERR